jgi:hypothetical protein
MYFIEKEREMSKVLVKSAWGSDDPTKAAFPFLHANALAEAGYDVQIFLWVKLFRLCGILLPMRLFRLGGRLSRKPYRQQ